MKSGTEKNPNPHTPRLGKFLRSLEHQVSKGYVKLRNGQIMREDTLAREQDRRAQQARAQQARAQQRHRES